MTRSAQQLQQDALAIWLAGVEAVRSDRLVREQVQVANDQLHLGDEAFDLATIDRIIVVGAGKAGAGMAAGLEEALGPKLLAAKRVSGWVNVPADCLRPTQTITLHAARAAGVNEPSTVGIAGTEEILRLVSTAGPRDLCICLISGGASALLPAVAEGLTLADKLAVTQVLSSSGANIAELNTVRKQLSRVKGGRLAAACNAGRMVTLIISDVLGDPLDVIASGPTVRDSTTAGDALAVIDRFDPDQSRISAKVRAHLVRHANVPPPVPRCVVSNLVIGNNAVAVDAAGIEAVRRGYSPALSAATELEGEAEALGRHLAEMGLAMRRQSGPDCLISGGEPIVRLAPADTRGLGGRNQQLVLAGAELLAAEGAEGILLLSGGTDGEDGPTDAAGAWIDAEGLSRATSQGLEIADHLRRNDAYRYFEPIERLLRTGPTHTNVCDVRVVLVDRES